MSDPQNMPYDDSLPDEFIEQIKQVLEHLYDFPYLQRHPLAKDDDPNGNTPAQPRAQRLRREVLAAIEALSPGPGVGFRAPHARLYNLLHLRYVEGLTVQEVANELGISSRQMYRDLRRGEESVAAMLWANRSKTPSQQNRARNLSSVQAEMERLELRQTTTEVSPILEHVQNAVKQLARQRNVTLHIETPTVPIIIYTDPAIAQQVLISTLSRAIQQAEPGNLFMTLVASQARAALTLRYARAPGAADSALSPVTAQLAERLGWAVEEEEHQTTGEQSISLSMTAHGPTILVIDDNEGLVDLISRYLSNHACRVVTALSGEEGLRLAQELIPDAILLDVMMPLMDGWEVLQTLATRLQTAAIPVIVCSVFNDPELAYSLGASYFLSKPVQRDDVLAALHGLGVV
jgi:CheY-like chemotaxis protein/transposase